MATVRYSTRPGKNKHTIYLNFSFGRGNELRYSTKWTVKSQENFDQVKSKVRNISKEPNAALINQNINNLENFVLKKYQELQQSGTAVTKEILRYELDVYFGVKRKPKKTTDYKSFLDCFRWYYEHFSKHPLPSTKKPLATGTLKSYITCFKILNEYSLTISPLDYGQITQDFYYSFLEFLWDKGYSNNYISRHIKMIKTIMNYAYENRFHKNLAYRSKSFSKVEEQVNHIYLTIDELDQIQNLKLSGDLDLARDWFIIAANTGLRVSDYKNLTLKNIVLVDNKKVLKVITKKTGKVVYIPLKESFLKIIKKNNGSFPKRIAEQTINKNIKVVGRIAGLKETVVIEKTIGGIKKLIHKPKYSFITNHTARRSFCTNAYKAGVPASDIMEISGHTSERNFFNYIKLNDLERFNRIAQHPFFK